MKLKADGKTDFLNWRDWSSAAIDLERFRLLWTARSRRPCRSTRTWRCEWKALWIV